MAAALSFVEIERPAADELKWRLFGSTLDDDHAFIDVLLEQASKRKKKVEA